MVGTQAPQKLFGDIPPANAQIPGMVTPNITAAMPNYADLEGILNAQNKQKAISSNAWARAAAINNARAAQSNAPQGHYLPSTASQTSGMGEQNVSGVSGATSIPGFQGPVLFAPRNLKGPQLGTWSDQQQKKALAENRAPPLIFAPRVGDPYTPFEPGGAPNATGGSTFMPSRMGTSNPAVWAKMWKDRARSEE